MLAGLASTLAAGWGLQGCATNTATLPARRPNLLVVLADDLGFADLGAYGSEIPTPYLDALAAEGRLLPHLLVAPVCSPTRASLLSGADHHLAGVGGIQNMLALEPDLFKEPGYEGYLNERSFCAAELLRDAGYHTYLSGKWHLARKPEQGPAHRGFERSFCLMTGAAPHWAPVPGKETVPDHNAIYLEDDKRVSLPPDFYSTKTYTDRMIEFIDAGKADGRPFFGYLAYTAPHWPLHAPDEDIARFKGKYDVGYEAIREARIARQRKLGLFPPQAPAARSQPDSAHAPLWENLTPDQRQLEARKMEIYAAMVSNLDRNFGRLVEHLRKIGEYENTMILFLSDNGACSMAENIVAQTNMDNSLQNIGRPRSNVAYGERWAEVSSGPLRWFKWETTEGGVRSPGILHLPGQTHALPALRETVHVTDILPTLLTLAKAPNPGDHYHGRPVHPLSGASWLPALQSAQAQAIAPERLIFEEHLGVRSARQGRWKLLTTFTQPADLNRWELYDLEVDPGETADIAAVHPEIVRRLRAAYEQYATANGVQAKGAELLPKDKKMREGAPTASVSAGS
ncbi:sulfatase-like hydrolase/transferase [Ideonella azotifigens]|nr:sulfatase-like hydrolase/transferase [Ideonella azotifigens]